MKLCSQQLQHSAIPVTWSEQLGSIDRRRRLQHVGYDCEFCWRYRFGSPGKKEGAAYVNLLTVTSALANNRTVGGYVINVAMFTVATALIAKYSETNSKSYAAAALTFLFLYVTA